MKKFFILISASFLLPLFAVAQTRVTTLETFLTRIVEIINGVLVPLVFAIAFIVFIWGIFQYFIAGASDEEKRENGKTLMIYGLIGFFVMASVWGIVNLLVNTFGLDTDVNINFPDAVNRNLD